MSRQFINNLYPVRFAPARSFHQWRLRQRQRERERNAYRIDRYVFTATYIRLGGTRAHLTGTHVVWCRLARL